MPNTTKPASDLDSGQTLQNSFNDVNSTISTDGFLVGKVGRRFDLAISTTNVSNDTETYSFSESGTTLYVIQIVYTDGSRNTPLYGSRIS